PVIIVSPDHRNTHPRVQTVLGIPLTTSVHKDVPSRVFLAAGETGLSADSAARAEDITVIRKENLIAPRYGLRRISNARVCHIGLADVDLRGARIGAGHREGESAARVGLFDGVVLDAPIAPDRRNLGSARDSELREPRRHAEESRVVVETGAHEIVETIRADG